jgi:dTDP-4-dehydrorhamnose 3,5-epimerase
MQLTPTSIDGAWTIDLDRQVDRRGWFARAFCVTELASIGLDPVVRQANISHTEQAGTVRGLHFQYPPADESKVVRVMSGAISDVIVDLRPESATFLDHIMIELSADSGRALIVPPRCAHGFMTLTDQVEVLYLMSRDHAPNDEGGLRFDDPDLAIEWPRTASLLSDRDAAFPTVRHQRATIAARMAAGAPVLPIPHG